MTMIVGDNIFGSYVNSIRKFDLLISVVDSKTGKPNVLTLTGPSGERYKTTSKNRLIKS